MTSAKLLFPSPDSLILQEAWTFPQMRALAWQGDVLFASRGYVLYSARFNTFDIRWTEVGGYTPPWWRRRTCQNRLSFRLVRDGFHALAILPNGNVIAAVPGAIVTLPKGEAHFQVSHRIERGTRPLHICVTPAGLALWGEYFDNPQRSEVHVYGSTDGGLSWQVIHTFPSGEIRHVHNIVYDREFDSIYVLTGDYGKECQILIASSEFGDVRKLIGGTQQARAVGAIPGKGGLYFASDTPLEQNFIYHLAHGGGVRRLSSVLSSSIDGCRNKFGIFFSTMVEPSPLHKTRNVCLIGSSDGEQWRCLQEWQKDSWPMRWFQYGALFFPSGENNSDLLALSTVAVRSADLRTTIFRTRVQ
jgi:hypothetical protein